jgi:hypothetical protein
MIKEEQPQPQIADTYYRDIELIMAMRDLNKIRKKRNTSVEMKSREDLSKYTGKGVYQLDQPRPLADQEVYLQSEKKPMTI